MGAEGSLGGGSVGLKVVREDGEVHDGAEGEKGRLGGEIGGEVGGEKLGGEGGAATGVEGVGGEASSRDAVEEGEGEHLEGKG